MKSRLPVLILALCIAVFLSIPAAAAQETPPSAPVEFTGTVEAVDGASITVGGLPVDITSIDSALASQITVGTVVSISGTLQSGTVTALTLVIVTPAPTPTDEPPPDSLPLGTFVVSYGGRVSDGSSTTFTYTVSGTGAPPDLSHFDVEIPHCEPALEIIAFSPAEAVEIGVDPTTGVDGIKWDLPLGMNESRTYSITFAGAVAEGTVTAAVKAGNGFTAGTLPGPACSQAAVDVEKSVTVNGSTWHDADTVPGPEAAVGADVSFRFTVRNTGTVPLTDISLTDNVLDTSTCQIPATLEPEATFDCVIGPIPAEQGQHANTASVSASFEGQTVTDTDDAHYFGGESDDDDDDDTTDLPVTIVIEGPVETININIITIYGINIEVNPDDPILTVIQIGDHIRVEGDTASTSGNTIIIVAINITIIDVDVVIIDDDGGRPSVWRDSGRGCGNPPPPWAPAHGWRARCEGRGGPGNWDWSGRDSDRSGRGSGRDSGRSSRRS